MSRKQLPEHHRWWGFSTPVWVGITFIIFCIAMAIVAMSTVASNQESHIELRTSSQLSYDPNDYFEPEGGTKMVYWRVKQSEVPRWKRPTNRWHKLKYAYPFKRWNRQDAVMKDDYTVKEFRELKENLLTVGDVRRYQKRQKEIYRKNNQVEIEKAKIKNAKKMWDDVE